MSDFTPPVPFVTALSDGGDNLAEGTWPDRVLRQVNRAELHSYRCKTARAVALVCAGGGYTSLMLDKEGGEVAMWLNGLGIEAHVLVHRLPGAMRADGSVHPKDVALRDGEAALDHLARVAAHLPLLIIGLSSGGHLAGVLACVEPRQRTAGTLIAYAPLNANHRQHKFPPGKPDYPPAEKQAFYDDWPVGLEGYPHAMPRTPLFLAYALHDQAVPVEHALRIIREAARTGHELDAHVFADAPHGFALRAQAGTHAVWSDLARDWIDARLMGN